MKKVLFWVLVAGAVGAGVWYAKRPAVVEPPKIMRAAVSRGAITETVKAMGVIEPRRRVNVGSQVSGVVRELYADFNSVVKEGDLLAEIEASSMAELSKVLERVRLIAGIRSTETNIHLATYR